MTRLVRYLFGSAPLTFFDKVALAILAVSVAESLAAAVILVVFLTTVLTR